MKIQYGLISSDSHGQLEKNAFVRRMSVAKWGDSIPHMVEITDEGIKQKDRPLDGSREGYQSVWRMPLLGGYACLGEKVLPGARFRSE
jgi:hypothetical protein